MAFSDSRDVCGKRRYNLEVAKVRTCNGILNRPFQRICYTLELRTSVDEDILNVENKNNVLK